MKKLLCLYLLFVTLAAAWEPPAVPADIARDYVAADLVLNEQPCDWRAPLAALFLPAVQDCTGAREATLRIASQMTALTGAYYSTERRKPNMNALEALAEKKISCTGQSILLICALRSIGIPARAVFVPTWGHIRGNHTWAEAWIDGEWQMIEFNEKDFNTPWVMENIGLLKPELPAQRVYAAAPGRPGCRVFYGGSFIAAEDVTPRYTALAQEWYTRAQLPADHQRLLVNVLPRPAEAIPLYLETEDGTRLASAPSPTAQSDFRYHTPFNLPRSGKHYLRVGNTRITLTPTSTPAQTLCIPLPAE